MYVVDITRNDGANIESDLLLGKLSTDAKEKTINYIWEYALANLNINLSKEELDQDVNTEYFSLKNYLRDKYKTTTNKDLIIQTFPTIKEKCLLVKSYDKDLDEMPNVYLFNNNEEKLAKGLMAYMINEKLINSLGEDNKLNKYESQKKDIHNFNDISFSYGSENYEVYNGGLFMEELLNNAISYKQIKNDTKDIDI